MKVSMFRVEKPCGAGPYVGNEDDPALAHMFAVHGDEDHPDPYDDPMLGGIYPDEVCGFPTLCGVEEWFAGYEDPLDAAGYRISVYSVPLQNQNVRYGHKQAVFVKANAELIRTFPLV